MMLFKFSGLVFYDFQFCNGMDRYKLVTFCSYLQIKVHHNHYVDIL